LEKFPCFSFAKNTPFFTLFVSTSVLLFLELRLAFDFRLDLCSDLALSLHQGVFFCLWSILVFIKRGVYKKFEWCWKREKALCKKVVQEGLKELV
jgi:hypothetical protein